MSVGGPKIEVSVVDGEVAVLEALRDLGGYFIATGSGGRADDGVEGFWVYIVDLLCLLDECFCDAEVRSLASGVGESCDAAYRVYEEDGNTVRDRDADRKVGYLREEAVGDRIGSVGGIYNEDVRAVHLIGTDEVVWVGIAAAQEGSAVGRGIFG